MPSLSTECVIVVKETPLPVSSTKKLKQIQEDHSIYKGELR